MVLIDDLLATGGTAQAAVELMRKVGAEVVGAVFLIELMGLKGGDGAGARRRRRSWPTRAEPYGPPGAAWISGAGHALPGRE